MKLNSKIKKYSFPAFIFTALSFILIGSTTIHAQSPKKPTSGEIYKQMEKLNFLGSVLYIAAHPDDENTRLISYFANEKNAYTTYLSLTRGDGGQNLIGPEISELLGVIRTQELLQARATDNGNQMFTRANDFGYSKNAEETIEIWDTEKVKADVVWAIRNTRPDIVINRFDHLSSGKTHGHHTASALLSYEMFDQSGLKNAYPEQLEYVMPWQPRRLFLNTSWWWYGSQEAFDKVDKSQMTTVDVGVYFPLLGKSNTEIAALSRSKHKCQGFGATGTRGSDLEYLEFLKGDKPQVKDDPFYGINTSWTRVKGGEMVKPLVHQLISDYDFLAPEKSIPQLVNIYKAIKKTEDPFWRNRKLQEVKELIAACSGLFYEIKSSQHKVVPGDSLLLDFEVVKRLGADITLKSIKGNGFNMDSISPLSLDGNKNFKWSKTIKVPESTRYTTPYWLFKKHEIGLYTVDDQRLIGKPQSDRVLKADFVFDVHGLELTFTKDLIYKFNSPSYGETYRPLEVVPPMAVNVKEPVYIFENSQPKDIKITVSAWSKNQSGTLEIPLPNGWTSEPKNIDFNLENIGESRDFTFRITPPQETSVITIEPQIKSKGMIYNLSMIDINYDHIPFQTVLKPSSSKLANIQIETRAKKVAYIMGAGDDIPESLRQIGCTVDLIEPTNISPERLAGYDALIMGVRAYNTDEGLKFKQNIIFDYVKNGGNVVVQYNTSHALVTKDLAPYPITLSRERVTVEGAEMRILAPHHSVLNYPNKIQSRDFEGWVQERGLYFPSEWDSAFTAVFSCNDPGEKPSEGSLLVAPYGKGNYVYTGISFFRQLVAGVPGAYRLFANLISIEQNG